MNPGSLAPRPAARVTETGPVGWGFVDDCALVSALVITHISMYIFICMCMHAWRGQRASCRVLVVSSTGTWELYSSCQATWRTPLWAILQHSVSL